MPPRVPTVILTQDPLALLERALPSVLTQTLSDLQLIVVLDATREATHQMLANLQDSRLRTTELATSRGTGHARNVRVRQALPLDRIPV